MRMAGLQLRVMAGGHAMRRRFIGGLRMFRRWVGLMVLLVVVLVMG